ncbi:hypothetical protein BDN71DRAFT_127661 [Pleurotus eryngii]|uniref:Uncharacterized protein n=1 Tax=Pleurotus eryngii TaxID=5323 RepID=A0A9P6A9K6_PLEER|nr:hypothetical protein BDN71DRAFT_127661 [Pleurotus eryngii]
MNELHSQELEDHYDTKINTHFAEIRTMRKQRNADCSKTRNLACELDEVGTWAIASRSGVSVEINFTSSLSGLGYSRYKRRSNRGHRCSLMRGLTSTSLTLAALSRR